MASAGATAEVAALYITERHGDGPRRVLRLVPAWQTSDLFGAGDLGFPDDPSGSSAEVRLLAFRDGMLAASIDLYDSATEGQEDLSASNRLEIFMWPEHACLKVFEGMPNRWVSTSSYLMMSLADCTESRSSKDIYTPGTGKIISGHYQDGHPCRFVGHYDHHTHLSFSPIQMELGNHIIKSADLIGFGSGGRVSGCTLFHQYQGALKCCFIHRPKNEPLEVEILSMFYHPNIVRFYYAGLDQEDDVFICTELCVRTFEEFINEISEDKIASIAKHFKEIISGLAEVHRHGVVHRDVKPQNILLDDNNCIRIIDFGNVSAYMPSGGGFLAPAFCGTELYMSPELKRERIHNEKTDVFSLGIVYFTSFGRSVQDVRQLLCKVHFSATWNRQDDYESWKTYKFAQGWQGSVPLLKRMLMTMPGGRASMNELFELLSKSSS